MKGSADPEETQCHEEWSTQSSSVNFRQVVLQTTGDQTIGAVDVLTEGQLIGVVPITMRVRGVSEPVEDDGLATGQARMFERIFASYSHTDRSVVDACARVYTALGIYVYIDHQLLRSGQNWRAMLKEHIERSDVFQLFWSKASSQSDPVRAEWEEALAVARAKRRLVRAPAVLGG